MKAKPKFEIVASLPRERNPAAYDAFHEDRVRRDLAAFANAPGIFTQYVDRARIRFQKASERAVLERWIEFYQTGERLVAAKTAMERKKSEYLQLASEHEISQREKKANIDRLRADSEEHALRRDKAAYQRKHLERFVEGGRNPNISENEQKLKEAQERRDMDARWEVHESLSASSTLIELQHWRREQRDRVLKDRSLTPEEQSEDLKFVDDLYQQKRGELSADARIFEDR